MRAFTKSILLFEGAAFGLTTAFLWANEVLDLPHRFLGAPPTPINWRESVSETIVVLALAVGTLWWTYRALQRIRYLEGFHRVCIHCKRVDVEGEWSPIVDYVTKRSVAVFSHGLCPECLEEHYADEIDCEIKPKSER